MDSSRHTKSVVFILLLLAMTGKVLGQTFDDSPSKEWYYGFASHDIWTSRYFYQHLITVGDTTLMGKECIIIKQADDYGGETNPYPFMCENMGKERFFLYRETDRLLWYNEEIGEFTTLHDYSAQEGDSWTIQVNSCSFDVVVDSTDLVYFGGKNHRVLYVHDSVYGTSYFPFYEGCIIEDIGHTQHFFPIEIYWRCNEMACCSFQSSSGLRCYIEEGEILWHQGDLACDSVYTVNHSGIMDFDDSFHLKIYPNPTTGIVRIESEEEEIVEIQVYNSLGLLVKTFQDAEEIHLETLPKGIYLLLITDTKNTKYETKVILK